MNRDLLERLAQAETEAERSWIVTESLLEKLSPSLSAAVWAVAVPHWFDAKILAALRPELQDQAEQLYANLQTLSFVEVFPDRGHNIHERTRKLILDRLWQENPEEFRLFSARAAAYFEDSLAQNDAQDPKPALQIERLYHLAAVNTDRKGNDLWNLAQTWTNALRRAELESLIKALLEQVESNRAANPVKAEVYYWAGRAKFRFYGTAEALDRYEQALSFYRDIGERLGEANTLQAIGDVLQFLNRRTEALDRYEQALGFYRDIGERLGEANTLQAIGDVLQFLKRSTEALDRYEQALSFYRNIGSRLGEANTLRAIGDVLQFLDRRTEALDRYEQALGFYRDIGSRLGEANTLQVIGDVLQFLKRSTEALDRYEQALGFYRDIGERLGEANTLRAIGDVLQFLKRSTEALDRYEQALGFYRDIGERLGEANTLQAIGDVLQFLDRTTEALESYEQALSFYREIGDRLGEANTLQAIGIMQEDGVKGLAACLEALELYVQIGDKYSQSGNLIYFTANVQLRLGQPDEAIDSLNRAAALAAEIGYEPFCEAAEAKIQSIRAASDAE